LFQPPAVERVITTTSEKTDRAICRTLAGAAVWREAWAVELNNLKDEGR
jgi:hypothetical protein